MRFGVWTPLPHTVPKPDLIPDMKVYGPGGADDGTYLDFAVDVIGRADEFGFDVTLVAERFMGPDLESWILATTLAARTSRITIMPAVHPGVMPPQVVAKLAMSLDRVSGGRAAINVVNGWWEDELQNYSNGQWLTDPEGRYRRMGEYMEVLHLLWSGEPATFQGEYFQFTDTVLPMSPISAPPQIFGASSHDVGREAMATFGDVWFLGPSGRATTLRAYDADFDADLEYIRTETAAMKAAAESKGRSIQCGMAVMVVIGDTESEALEIVDTLDDFAARGFLEAVSVGGAAIFGTPERVVNRIEALSDAGVDLLMIKFAPMRNGLERFGTLVMPLLTGGAKAP
ncbi:LLM class flavin-dependent oxidoreductase [Microbacterium sp. E-13]|uniref:LLM class flavin-dependent oxidoreductase n=1 Tax=Microbacterium sp. E-13 TaxID=3404048 RepID=UPI003CEF23E9